MRWATRRPQCSAAAGSRRAALISGTAALCLLIGGVSFAEEADSDDDDDDDKDQAAERFPQPVRVGALLNRTVLEPLESQPILGHVRELVRAPDGSIIVVVNYGGFFGFGARPIGVPVDAMTLLGQDMEIVGFKPEELDKFPTFDAAGTSKVGPDEVIRVGLSKPSH